MNRFIATILVLPNSASLAWSLQVMIYTFHQSHAREHDYLEDSVNFRQSSAIRASTSAAEGLSVGVRESIHLINSHKPRDSKSLTEVRYGCCLGPASLS